MFVLQFSGRTVSPQLLSVLPPMTNLQKLSLKTHADDSNPAKLSSDIVEPLCGCLSLRSLDVLNTKIPIKVVSFSKKSYSPKEVYQSISTLSSKQFNLDSGKQMVV